MSEELSHLDETGQARMVDVGGKPVTERIAIAKGEILMSQKALELIIAGQIKKGDVLSVARIAGVMAAKRTAELIPLCHPLPLNQIAVSFNTDQSLPGIRISAEVKSTGKTGVEMEALTAVAVSALTIYDMAKSVDKKMRIDNIRLVEKYGGQSGDVHNE
jgi:cyclic pyranopterin phosphate synthase